MDAYYFQLYTMIGFVCVHGKQKAEHKTDSMGCVTGAKDV